MVILVVSFCRLNEEMIETLFKANDPNSRTRDGGNAGLAQSANQENQFLDPRKSHNIAILLRALNVTADEVCEALVEGEFTSLSVLAYAEVVSMSKFRNFL